MLIKWSPLNDLLSRDYLGDFFDDFSDKVNPWKPVVDIYEDEEKVVVEAELPGIDPKDINITVDQDRLIIKGKTSKTKENKSFFRTERIKGSFMRSFLLPTSVESEKILASYEKGVLTVSIPKMSKMIPRKVDIKVRE